MFWVLRNINLLQAWTFRKMFLHTLRTAYSFRSVSWYCNTSHFCSEVMKKRLQYVSWESTIYSSRIHVNSLAHGVQLCWWVFVAVMNYLVYIAHTCCCSAGLHENKNEWKRNNELALFRVYALFIYWFMVFCFCLSARIHQCTKFVLLGFFFQYWWYMFSPSN